MMPEENVLLPSVCSKCYNEAAIYSVTREPRIAAELILQKSNSLYTTNHTSRSLLISR